MPLPLLMLVVIDRLSENEEVLGKTDFFLLRREIYFESMRGCSKIMLSWSGVI